MNTIELEQIAHYLVANWKGILAADESTASANKRFTAVGVEETEENRRQYRQLLLTTPAARATLSGVIFYDETFWQNADDGRPLRDLVSAEGILPGIKLDEGLVDLPGFPGEKVSKGLDSLPDRLEKYRAAGAKFAKWRSVITIGSNTPSPTCIRANAYVLARYARLCQEFDIVPIVEPEALFDGTHSSEQCEEVLAQTLIVLFAAMKEYQVYLPGAILKTSMVLPGKNSGTSIDVSDVSTRTVRVLHDHVPRELGGVVFLSGGQTAGDALKNLNEIARKGPHPWGLTFSFSRALQDPVLKHWALHRDDLAGAQRIFGEQLKAAVDAREGKLHLGSVASTFVSGSQDL